MEFDITTGNVLSTIPTEEFVVCCEVVPSVGLVRVPLFHI